MAREIPVFAETAVWLEVTSYVSSEDGVPLSASARDTGRDPRRTNFDLRHGLENAESQGRAEPDSGAARRAGLLRSDRDWA
jgi:hypothetical protein